MKVLDDVKHLKAHTLKEKHLSNKIARRKIWTKSYTQSNIQYIR